MIQVNQKMILTLTASIMYWSLQQPVEETESSAEMTTLKDTSVDGDNGSVIGGVSNLCIDDAASDTSSQVENGDASVE